MTAQFSSPFLLASVLCALLAACDSQTGGFENPTWSMDTTSCEGGRHFGYGDVDGDGKRDIAVYSRGCDGGSRDQLVVFAGTSKRYGEPIVTLDMASASRRMRIMNVDGDAHDDIRLLDLNEWRAPIREQVFLGSPSGLEAPVEVTGAAPIDRIAFDIDGDGRDELVGAGSNFLTVHHWQANPPSWEIDEYAMATQYGSLNEVGWIGDHNSDGHWDLLARLGDEMRIIYGCTGCSLDEPLASNPIPQFGALPRSIGDVTGNGYPDLLASRTGSDLQVYMADDNGNYTLEPNWSLPARSGPEKWVLNVFHAGDFDLDGNAFDLIVTRGDDTYFFPSNSSGPLLEPAYVWEDTLALGMRMDELLLFDPRGTGTLKTFLPGHLPE